MRRPKRSWVWRGISGFDQYLMRSEKREFFKAHQPVFNRVMRTVKGAAGWAQQGGIPER
jgi:hypothetical protein